MAVRPACTDSPTVGPRTAVPVAGQIGPHRAAAGSLVGRGADSAAAGLVAADRPTTASELDRRWAQPGAEGAGWVDALAELAAGVRSTTCASGRRVRVCRAPSLPRAFCLGAGWAVGLAARPALGPVSGPVCGPSCAQSFVQGPAPASGLGWLVNSRANSFQNDQKSQPPSPAGWHSISANRGASRVRRSTRPARAARRRSYLPCRGCCAAAARCRCGHLPA